MCFARYKTCVENTVFLEVVNVQNIWDIQKYATAAITV